MESNASREPTDKGQTAKVCPLCGYSGFEASCPLDGELMVRAAKNESPTLPMEWENGAPKAADFGQWPEPDLPDDKKRSLTGQTLDGRFEVGPELGRGGMGRVYEAFQPAVQRTVAIKVLSRGFSENREAVKRFHREALAASRLSHPNAIGIYDFGESDGWLYMAMERLEGRDLAQTLDEEGPFDADRAIGIAIQVARALDAAHEQNVIHRDLKPANVFLCNLDGHSDFVKVLDFGVAKILTDGTDTAQMTQAGSFFGTPQYMAPEQASEDPVDRRTDVYALGILLYEMCMGRAPFVGENPLNIMLAQSRDTPPRFESIRHNFRYPEQLESVVFQALAKSPAQRQKSAGEFATQLEVLRDGIRNPATQISRHELLPPPLPNGNGFSAASDQSWEAKVQQAQVVRSNRWVWPLLALAFALALWFNQGSLETSPTQPAPQPSAPLSTTEPTAQQPAFEIRSEPRGADLVDANSGAVAGQTPVMLQLSEKTSFRLSKSGFVPRVITLDPADEDRTFLYMLTEEDNSKRNSKPTPVARPKPARPKPVAKPKPVIQTAPPELTIPPAPAGMPPKQLKALEANADSKPSLDMDVPLEME